MFRTALISLFITSTALANPWYVDDDGKFDFDNIQAAVDAASDGDMIFVYPGTYTSTSDEVVNMLGKAVTLRSLYPNNPDVVAATIIDGEGVRRGIRCDNEESNKTNVEGFTITAGMAIDGGGIYIRESSPTITNCTIIDNTADDDGGGLFIRDGSPTITNCTIGSNTTGQSGGGLFIRTGTPAISQCTIKGNVANEDGGGIYCRDNANATIINCFIEDNIAGEDGGGLTSDDSVPAIGGTQFCGNEPSHIDGVWSNTGGNKFFDSCSGDCLGDIDGNGVVDVIDLLAVIGAWGECVGQKVHIVNQIGMSFIPSELTVTNGDMIRWVWGGGSHTVTSGTLPCEADGLFDGPLEDDAPVFEWYVPSNSPDFIEYFCEPHCFQDMNGSISVTTASNGPGSECPADIDDSGTVDVSDLLMVIGNWGECE